MDHAGLEQLPFGEQVAHIERACAAGPLPPALWRTLAALRDHEPLAHAVVTSERAGLLADGADELTAALLAIPDTGVQRVLRALDRHERAPDAPPVAAGAVGRVFEALPIERVAALCLIDRWLKNTAPALRAAIVARALEQITRAAAGDALETVTDATLARVPGRALQPLADTHPALRARLDALAGRVLDVLGAAPKSLSQANAEELLARRVYTDPGHFLVELLQNADDAGARAWHVELRDDAVWVWHDGVPFDVKDVVGVLSIGQTTKSAEQIGFFGVGFKSVYEVCERPQLYSDAFCFEIADVSIPRRLAGRPAGARSDGTLLVLPLRDPHDPLRSPDRLLGRALAVPPETLLTLRSLRELVIRRGDRGRSTRREDLDAGRVCLVHDDRDRTCYAVAGGRFEFDAARERGRARATDVLVALRLDEAGRAAPLGPDEPCVFSHLPTRERAGLRLLVHAHFDLPVDRERIDLDSRWNRWALACAGALVPAAARAALAGSEAACALLDVLPIASAGAHPALAAIADAARPGLAALPCLPGADGTLIAPARATRLVGETDALVEVLAGVELDGRQVLARLDEQAAIAEALGATRFGGAELVERLVREPTVLERGHRAILRVLAAELPRLPSPARDRLAEVPLARADDGETCRPTDVARAEDALRAVYAGVRPLLDEALDEPALAPLWQATGVPVLDADTLLADLRAPARAARLLDAARIDATIGFLIARPPQLARFFEALAAGGVALADDEAGWRLLTALDRQHEELSPRLAARLAAAPLFPDQHGLRRPLRGPDAARWPADDDIITLAPATPWLAARARSLAMLARMGAAPIGGAHVARALAGDDVGLAIATADDAGLRRAYAYLTGHAGAVDAALRERLATSPVWLDRRGGRAPLAALRRSPTDPALADLYARWTDAAIIDGEDESEQLAAHRDDAAAPGTALALARALDLTGRVAASDHAALIADLHAGHDVTPVREQVLAALAQAARILAPSRLRDALAAPIYRGDDGELHAIAGYDDALDAGCLWVVDDDLRAALALGSRPLLDRDDARVLASLLDAADLAAADLHALADAIERDPAMRRSAALEAARAAVRAAVAKAGTPDAALGARLAALPLWPDVAGVHRPAAALVRPAELTALLEPRAAGVFDAEPAQALAGLSDDVALLAAHADADAGALRAVFTFADPRAALAAAIARLARPGEPLADQDPLLSTPERVAALARILPGQRTDLAVAVDATGRLVTPPRFRATDSERQLAAGLPLDEALAAPAWAARVDEQLAPPLPLRRLVNAIADDARAAIAVAAHPRLRDRGRREALYAWLLEHAELIAADGDARGVIARACVIATSGGSLRSPRELLFDDDLPDLGIDWNAAAEVPAPLVTWLRRTFAPGDAQLARIVEHLLDAADQAATARDGERSALLCGHLARVLRVGELEPGQVTAAVRRFKLRKRLRVETDHGDFARPRTLLIAPPEELALIATFAASPPRQVSARYGEARTAELIALAGAERRLADEALQRGIAGERASGAAAAIALARYLARVSEREPALRDALRLATSAWLPDGHGTPRRPDALYWPDGDARHIVGDASGLFPHDQVRHELSEALIAHLPFRRAADAALPDVIAHLDARAALGEHEADAALLGWLDEGLARGHLRASDVHQALAGRRLLRDDAGVLRRPDELVREEARALLGAWRGTWTAGDTYTRLAAALKIPKHAGKREVLAHLAEIERVLDSEGGDALLARDPGLAQTLPRCLVVLARAGGALPTRLPLACETSAGDIALRVAPAPDVFLPVGAEAAGAIDRAAVGGAPVTVPLLPDEDTELVLALLARLGISRLEGDEPAVETPPAAPRPTPGRRARDDGPGNQPRRDDRDDDGEDRFSERDHDRDDGDSEHDRDEPGEPTEAHREQERGGGLLRKIRSWLGADDERRPDHRETTPPEQRERGDTPPGPPHAPTSPRSGSRDDDQSPPPPRAEMARQRGWFRAGERIGPQLGTTSFVDPARRRAATFGLAFEPRALPPPWTYAPHSIAGRFEPAGQRWLELSTADPAWRDAPADDAAHQLACRGRLPGGSVLLPVPTGGRVTSMSASPSGRLVHDRRGAPTLIADGDVDVEYTVALPRGPSWTDARVPDDAPPELLALTVDDGELPAETLRLVDACLDIAEPMARATAVRDFVRDRYAYDPSYLEQPEIGQWLRRLTRGRSNAHLAALHAGRDRRFLGRGVCYELNALACELLRRAGIPAAVATGWTFDRGYLDEPDHMWAVALLDPGTGPRWLPIDASATRSGRPLHAGRRPPGRWRAPRRHLKPPPAPAWTRDAPRQPRAGDAPPIAELMRIMRYLDDQRDSGRDTRALHDACRRALADPEIAAALRELLERARDAGD